MANSLLQVSNTKPDTLISVINSELCTSSVKIAEAFGKRHDDVLKKLKCLDCSADFRARNFAGLIMWMRRVSRDRVLR